MGRSYGGGGAGTKGWRRWWQHDAVLGVRRNAWSRATVPSAEATCRARCCPEGMRATSPCSLGYIVCGRRGAGAAAVRTCWRVLASREAASAAEPLGARDEHPLFHWPYLNHYPSKIFCNGALARIIGR